MVLLLDVGATHYGCGAHLGTTGGHCGEAIGAGAALEPGRLIALAGEAGYQAGYAPRRRLHFGFWRWQFRIIKVPVTVVPQGEIALVLAADGAAIPSERILAKVVDCDNFQDARKFLMNSGEKGRQLGILTGGTYRINSALFTVITSHTAEGNGMSPSQLELTRINMDMVGIVTIARRPAD